MNSDELRKTAGENIKRYRKSSNLTQMALAEKANLSVGYLESGKKWCMSVTISRLAVALNIQPFQLFLTKV